MWHLEEDWNLRGPFPNPALFQKIAWCSFWCCLNGVFGCQGRSVFVCAGTTRTMADLSLKVSPKIIRAVFETHKRRSVGCWMPIIERCLNCMKKHWSFDGWHPAIDVVFWLTLFKCFLIPMYPFVVVWQCYCPFHPYMTYSPTCGLFSWFSFR